METETKRVELPHFKVGKNYGSNQNWMMDPWMHLGGCAALTTCDAFISMSVNHGREDLWKFRDPSRHEIKRNDYSKFAMSVKLYLEPRRTGIKDLKTYTDGVELYLEDSDIEGVSLRTLDGSETYEKARDMIEDSLDRGIPCAYLMLKHQDDEFDFFEWHWFLVNGYEKKDGRFTIKAATYGKPHWLDLERLWDTGYDHRGGIVFFDIKE